MNNDGSHEKKIMDNIRAFFGEKYKEIDGAKYAQVLKNLDFPQFEGSIDAMCEDAEKLLSKGWSLPPEPGYASRLEVKKLGKPKMGDRNPEIGLDNQLKTLSERMADALASYKEDIALCVSHYADGGEYITSFAIDSENASVEPLTSLIRSVYSSCETRLSEERRKYSGSVYGRIGIPASERQLEEQRQQQGEKAERPWIDAVTAALPSEGEYRLRVRIIPLDGEAPELRGRVAELNRLRDLLAFYSETSHNTSTSLSSNYNRGGNILENVKNKIDSIFYGVEQISSNYSENFGATKNSKNKRAQTLILRLDHELNRLSRAAQGSVWEAEIIASADDENVLQTVTGAMSGALKPFNLELDWSGTPSAAFTAGVREIVPLMMFPAKEYGGFEFIENESFSLVSPAAADTGMNIGRLLQNGASVSKFYLPKQALNRHAFICGMTGSGKTNTLFRVMEEIDLPFVVIEPVKGEYRCLKNRYPDLRVWTMKFDEVKSDNIGVLRINPFWFPKASNIAFHIDSLKTIISSSFEMSAAMPNILEQCLYNVYINAGWDIVTNTNIYSGILPEEFLYPTFSELQKEIDYYLDHAKFGDEVMGNYRGAMSSRMKSFINGSKGLLLNTQEHPDYGLLMSGHNIIELEGLAEDADKCLVMGTILVQYFQYLKLHFDDSEKRLSHITVIEEAHRLFKNVKKQGNTENGADAVGQLVDSLGNIMAEIRAFGEGMLIVDQSSTKIADDVIKNTGTKIIHRVDNGEDIKVLQSALLIGEDKLSLPSLKQGEALIRTEGMTRPCKVKLDLSDIKEEYKLSSSFQKTALINDELQVSFKAMSILSSDKALEGVKECVRQLLTRLVDTEAGDLYESVEIFLRDMVHTLDIAKKYDIVGRRWAVIRQTASLAIKRMGADLSVKETGIIHLFTMRCLDLYWEQREGYPLKSATVRLLREYLGEHIAPIVDGEFSDGSETGGGAN